MTARLRAMLLMRGFKPKATERRGPLLPSLDLAGVAAQIRSGRAKNIIVMCGAGISVSAGSAALSTRGT